MLPATWFLVYLFKRLISFNPVNMGSVDQRAAKVLAIKLWEWFDSAQTLMVRVGPGSGGRLFMRSPTLTASNFAALWPTDLKFSAFKDLKPFSKCVKFQEVTSILRLCFVLSKWPHFDSGYLLGGPFGLHLIVHEVERVKNWFCSWLWVVFRGVGVHQVKLHSRLRLILIWFKVPELLS